MKKKNLSAKKTIHNFYKTKLRNNKIQKIYKEFKKNLNENNPRKICIAVSGGYDSLALAFLSKCYSIEKNIKSYFYTVDHKLRSESLNEAKKTRYVLKKFGITCKILTIKNKIKSTNIQSKAREARYKLIYKECYKNKINTLLTAHHQNDLIEGFFIRLIRGSGLKGLSSFSKTINQNTKNTNVNILRPLLSINKNQLIYIINNTFKFHIDDKSNQNDIFLRIRIRKLLNLLNKEGLNLEKFKKTINNLKSSNETIEFYVAENKKLNSKYIKNKKTVILNNNFFNHPYEIVFRSLTEIIHEVGNKTNFSRGNKINRLIQNVCSGSNKIKLTLSGCIIEKINKSLIIRPEFKNI